jgi:hypothetical protein
MRVAIVSGTTAFPEIAPETDAEGRYQLRSLQPGRYEVAVHDKDGRRLGVKSVGVETGETATVNFAIGQDLTSGDESPLPARPVMRLRSAGRVYDGAEGTYCWPESTAPDGSVVGLCADKFRWAGVHSTIPVERGSTVTIEVDADEPAQALSLEFFEIDSDVAVQFLEFGSRREVTLVVDVAEGVYNVAVFGRWPEGDITYEFRLGVRPPS